MLLGYFKGTARIALAGLLIALVAFIDWRVKEDIAFGFLYLFPILLIGTVSPRWHILVAALLCMFLSDTFSPPHLFTLSVTLPQDLLVFTALAGSGLFSYEVTRSHKREMANLERVEQEVAARREAEQQLEFLIETSPAAILTMGSDALVLRGNSAAHRLFGVPSGELPGRSIRRYVPALGRIPFVWSSPESFRTEMQCRGHREDGEVFLANVFFSTYNTSAGSRLAALIVDASEDLREREELSLNQLMAGSRILVGAISHEVRNVCSAISIVYENLARTAGMRENKDFDALGSLVETLQKIASLELKQSTSDSEVRDIDLAETLDNLRIVLDPYLQESGVQVHWEIPDDLPPVWGDRHRLTQVLLNLARNSIRAMEQAGAGKRLDISVSVASPMVSIRVTDSGPGIGSTRNLFQPFQQGAESTGLGLYLSRAFVRSFGGDLRHDPALPGCSFVIDLPTLGGAEVEGAIANGKDATLVGG